MTFDPARPRYTLPLGETEYDLVGTMGLVENVEYQMKKGIGQTAVNVVNDMTSTDLTKLLSAVLTGCGYDTSVADAKALLWDKVGLAGEENAKLRLHLYAFLGICLAPPEARERKAAEMGELVGKLSRASRGKPTRKPASAR